MDVTVDKTATLRAQMDNHQPLIFESHGMDARYRQMGSVAPAMSARCGTGFSEPRAHDTDSHD